MHVGMVSLDELNQLVMEGLKQLGQLGTSAL
jgi:hypothetical protein